jgi:hypothetical protein
MRSLCFINEALHHEDVWGSGRIDPTILDVSVLVAEWLA